MTSGQVSDLLLTHAIQYQQTPLCLLDFKSTSSKPKAPKAKTGSGLGSICSSTSSANKSTSKPKTPAAKPASKIRNIFDDIDIESEEKKDEAKEAPKPTTIRSIFDSLEDEDEVKKEDNEDETAKENGSAKDGDTMKITQVFDFAGENVR